MFLMQLASLRHIGGYCCSSIRRLQKLKGLVLPHEPLSGYCKLTWSLMRTDAGQSEQTRSCVSLPLSQHATESIWIEVTSITAVSRPNTCRTPPRRPKRLPMGKFRPCFNAVETVYKYRQPRQNSTRARKEICQLAL